MQGIFVILGSYMSYWLYTLYGVDPLITAGISMVVLFALGVFIHKIVLHRVSGAPLMTSFLLTYALAILFENIIALAWGYDTRTIFVNYLRTPINIGGVSFSFARIVILIPAVIVTALFFVFLKYSWTGKAWRAVSESREDALLVGVNENRIHMMAYGVSAAMSGMAGAFLCILFAFSPGQHFVWTSIMLIVVTFGGLGSIIGTVIAAFILSSTEIWVGFFISPLTASLLCFLFLIVVLLIRPRGLLGKGNRDGD